LAIAGNKNDMYEHEEVEENEGKELAKELGAIFQKTSAKESTGVEDLFVKIGKKFLNPNATETGDPGKVENKQKGQKLKASKAKGEEGKKGCC
jgi:Fe2+ transport system protein B